jgi:hypothetical protein
MRQEPGPETGQGGFAAVDALVAVTILSSTLALSLTAAEIGTRASRTAGETRDAELMLRGRLEDTAGQIGVWSGHAQGLDWRVEAHLPDNAVAQRGGPCVRTALAKSMRSGRTYRVATADTCLPREGA